MNVKHTKLFSFVLLLLLFLGCSATTLDEKQTSPLYSSKTSNGEVSITLTPRYENNGLIVQYAFNTHSVDMGSFDLQQQVVLASNGQQYHPTNKPTLSGHHNNGNLLFLISPAPIDFEINVIDVPDVKERRLSWP